MRIINLCYQGESVQETVGAHEIAIALFGCGETSNRLDGVFSAEPVRVLFRNVEHGALYKLENSSVGCHGNSSVGHFGIVR